MWDVSTVCIIPFSSSFAFVGCNQVALPSRQTAVESCIAQPFNEEHCSRMQLVLGILWSTQSEIVEHKPAVSHRDECATAEPSSVGKNRQASDALRCVSREAGGGGHEVAEESPVRVCVCVWPCVALPSAYCFATAFSLGRTSASLTS